MNTLIRLIARAIARPIERRFRAREGITPGRGVKINNLNYALVPFFVSLVLLGIAATVIVATRRQKTQDVPLLPFTFGTVFIARWLSGWEPAGFFR